MYIFITAQCAHVFINRSYCLISPSLYIYILHSSIIYRKNNIYIYMFSRICIYICDISDFKNHWLTSLCWIAFTARYVFGIAAVDLIGRADYSGAQEAPGEAVGGDMEDLDGVVSRVGTLSPIIMEVENGCIPNIGWFSTSMIMGERVDFSGIFSLKVLL